MYCDSHYKTGSHSRWTKAPKTKDVEKRRIQREKRIQQYGIEWVRERSRQAGRKSYIPTSQLSHYARERQNRLTRKRKQARRQKIKDALEIIAHYVSAILLY